MEQVIDYVKEDIKCRSFTLLLTFKVNKFYSSHFLSPLSQSKTDWNKHHPLSSALGLLTTMELFFSFRMASCHFSILCRITEKNVSCVSTLCAVY